MIDLTISWKWIPTILLIGLMVYLYYKIDPYDHYGISAGFNMVGIVILFLIGVIIWLI